MREAPPLSLTLSALRLITHSDTFTLLVVISINIKFWLENWKEKDYF